jgi:hypothetical protein
VHVFTFSGTEPDRAERLGPAAVTIGEGKTSATTIIIFEAVLPQAFDTTQSKFPPAVAAIRRQNFSGDIYSIHSPLV